MPLDHRFHELGGQLDAHPADSTHSSTRRRFDLIFLRDCWLGTRGPLACTPLMAPPSLSHRWVELSLGLWVPCGCLSAIFSSPVIVFASKNDVAMNEKSQIACTRPSPTPTSEVCADHCIGGEEGERIAIPEPSIVRHNRLAEKRIYRDCRIGEFVGSDDMKLSSRPIASISASHHSYQSRSKSAAWFHGTWHRNKIRQ
jgi:hypothetical protein